MLIGEDEIVEVKIFPIIGQILNRKDDGIIIILHPKTFHVPHVRIKVVFTFGAQVRRCPRSALLVIINFFSSLVNANILKYLDLRRLQQLIL
jgi:hypothetical protein